MNLNVPVFIIVCEPEGEWECPARFQEHPDPGRGDGDTALLHKESAGNPGQFS